MRRRVFTAAAAAAFSVCMSITAFAGQWRQDSNGWWYQNDDGSYPAGTWQWIDSNGDGTAECYYFYADGYMAYNNDIDGYHLNNDGQWEAGGRVQTKNTGGNSSNNSGSNQTYGNIYRQYAAQYGETRFVKKSLAYASDEYREHLDGINFLGLCDLDGNGSEELLIGVSVPSAEVYDGYRYVLDVYTNNGSGAVFCGRINDAQMWTGGEQSCGIRLMSNGGKIYVVTGSEGTGAGEIYYFYSLNNGTVAKLHTFDFNEMGTIIDGKKSSRSYNSIWSDWTTVGHYDFDGYVYYSFNNNPEYSMNKTRDLISITKTRLGV